MLRFLLLQNGDSIANLQALLSALCPDVASATLSINQMFLALPQKGSHGGICCAFAIPCLVSQTFLHLPSHPSAQHQMQKNQHPKYPDISGRNKISRDTKRDLRLGHQKGSAKCCSSKDLPPVSLEGGKGVFLYLQRGWNPTFSGRRVMLWLRTVHPLPSVPTPAGNCSISFTVPHPKSRSAVSSKTLHVMPFCIARSPVSYFPARKQKFPFWTNFSLP